MAQNADRDANSAALARFADMREKYLRMRGGVVDMQQRMATLTASADSDDRLVKATVGPRGQLLELSLDRVAYQQHAPHELAAVIVSTVGKATELMAAQLTDLVGEFMPADSAALRFLRSNDLGDLMRGSDETIGADGGPDRARR